MDITRAGANSMTKEIEAAAKVILAKHGLVLSPSKTKYGDIFELKITAFSNKTNDAGVNVSSPEAKAFLFNAGFHGIADSETVLATPVVFKGEEYKIVGYKPRSTKRPFILVKVSDGRSYVFGDSVAAYMAGYDFKKDFESDWAADKRARLAV